MNNYYIVTYERLGINYLIKENSIHLFKKEHFSTPFLAYANPSIAILENKNQIDCLTEYDDRVKAIKYLAYKKILSMP